MVRFTKCLLNTDRVSLTKTCPPGGWGGRKCQNHADSAARRGSHNAEHVMSNRDCGHAEVFWIKCVTETNPADYFVLLMWSLEWLFLS